MQGDASTREQSESLPGEAARRMAGAAHHSIPPARQSPGDGGSRAITSRQRRRPVRQTAPLNAPHPPLLTLPGVLPVSRL